MERRGFLKAPSIRAKLLLCFLAIALVVWGLLSGWALSTTRSFVEGKAISDVYKRQARYRAMETCPRASLWL